ncbi:MAG: hypothetical protein JOZ51_14605 [Chloroflexi bacterium]|nr:hypothetical protein [Chloroflexota bacterium]
MTVQTKKPTPRWVQIAWLVVFGFVVAINSPAASAYHYDTGNPRLHNKQIHYAGTGHSSVDEDFCTQVADGDGGLSEATLRARVDDTVLSQPSHWDGAGSWKLDMYHTSTTCFDPANGDRSAIEIQYRTYKYQTSGKGCGDGISCVTHYNEVSSGKGHNDFLNEVAWLDQDHVTASQYSYRQLISHETGHTVGFRDPSYGSCMTYLSIMHIPYYGCADPGSGPTSSDLSTLANSIMP